MTSEEKLQAQRRLLHEFVDTWPSFADFKFELETEDERRVGVWLKIETWVSSTSERYGSRTFFTYESLLRGPVGPIRRTLDTTMRSYIRKGLL